MKFYPIFLDINGRNCLVIGGGPVGARKAATLEKCGAKVSVISEEFSSAFEKMELTSVTLHKKRYEKQDLKGMFLVLAATNSPALNRRIKKDASQFNILCNVADAMDHSDFILPSIVNRGDLVFAVSTSGTSPAMAKKIRKDLEQQFGKEYSKMLQLMGAIRKELLSLGHAPDDHKHIFHSLIEKGLLKLIEADDTNKIDSILKQVLGKEYAYENFVSSRSVE